QGKRNAGPPPGGSAEPGHTHTNPSCSTQGTGSSAPPPLPTSPVLRIQPRNGPARPRAIEPPAVIGALQTPVRPDAPQRQRHVPMGTPVEQRPHPPRPLPEQAERRPVHHPPHRPPPPDLRAQAGDIPGIRQLDRRTP